MDRFHDWAIGAAQATDTRNAALYGLGMWSATEGRFPPPFWEEGGYRSLLATGRGYGLLVASARRLSDEADIRALIEEVDVPRYSACLVASTDKRWILEENFWSAIGYVGVFMEAERGFVAAGRLAEAYEYVGRMHYHAGRHQEALVCFDEALSLQQDNVRSLVGKGEVLRELGQPESGLVWTQRATFLNPDSPIAWYALGRYYEALGQLPEAEASLRRSLHLGVQDEWAKAVLARVLARQGRCAEALPYARGLVDAYPDHVGFLQVLGDTYWCLRDTSKAETIYRRLVRVAPRFNDRVKDRLGNSK